VGPVDDLPPVFGGVVSAEALSRTEIILAWDEAVDDFTPSDAIVYEVCISEVRVERGGCQPFVPDDESPPGALEHVVVGLEPDTRYFFVVRARDEADQRDDNLVEATALTPGDRATKAIAVGREHACALMARGTVRCWGDSGFGQLGDGTTASREVAAPVLGLERVKRIAAGTDHTCAAIADGTARCWGRNDRGQLGDGTTEDSAVPVVVAGLEFVKALAAGDGHTCALLGDGTVRCWGANDRGQLGDGSFEDRLEPAEVLGAAYIKDVACGAEHTCAVVADGTVACWGGGDAGQNGLASGEDVEVRTAIDGLGLVTNVACGTTHTCARVGDGSVVCWGETAGFAFALAPEEPEAPLALAALGIDRVSHIAAGGDHTCVRDGGGTAWCFAGGDTQATAVAESVKAIAIGDTRGCALSREGSLACWPVGVAGGPVDAGPVAGLTDYAGPVAVTVGVNRACALISDGTVVCWGKTGYFPDGTYPNKPGKVSPVKVSGVSGARAIELSFERACAALADGGLRCWGGDSKSALGKPSNQPLSSVVPPSSLNAMVDVVAPSRGAGSDSGCALLSGGEAVCWGGIIASLVPVGSAHIPLLIDTAAPATVVLSSGYYLTAEGLLRRWSATSAPYSSAGSLDFLVDLNSATGAFALRADGTAWFVAVSLGIHEAPSKYYPGPIQLTGFSQVEAIDSYAYWFIAGVRTNGRIQTWGAGNGYTLGISDFSGAPWQYEDSAAAFNQALEVELVDDAISVGTGDGTGCALIADGRVECWGARYKGNGFTEPSTHIPWEEPYLP
jgi:alpha-tubulin suppressor-like RCC1 family protein